jgi:hypothetical protein
MVRRGCWRGLLCCVALPQAALRANPAALTLQNDGDEMISAATALHLKVCCVFRPGMCGHEWFALSLDLFLSMDACPLCHSDVRDEGGTAVLRALHQLQAQRGVDTAHGRSSGEHNASFGWVLHTCPFTRVTPKAHVTCVMAAPGPSVGRGGCTGHSRGGGVPVGSRPCGVQSRQHRGSGAAQQVRKR